jgi:hypothetical protein
VTNTQYQLDLMEWPSGIYFVRVTAGRDIATYRLVKE